MGRRTPAPERPLTRIRARFPLAAYALITSVLALVYLHLASLSLVARGGGLPSAVHGIEAPAHSLLVVLIDEHGAVDINGKPCPRGDLAAEFKRHVSGENAPTVILRAAKGLKYKRVLDILDAAHRGGLSDIRVEVESP